MTQAEEQAADERVRVFLEERIGRHLRDKRKRASFATYFFGLLSDAERKSVEPMAAQSCGGKDPLEVRRCHQNLVHFVGASAWDDHAVRYEAARYACEALVARGEEVTTWVVDDTGFLKQGRHSVGVARQYTGSAGKVANCQVAVSLSVATGTEQLPLDVALYLPKPWAEDAARRAAAKVPREVVFQTKLQLALGLIERAVGAGIAGEVVLADCAYGEASSFRDTVKLLGLDYGVGVQKDFRVLRLDARDRCRSGPQRVDELAALLGAKAFRRITWKQGSKAPLHSRFAFARIKAAHDDGATDPRRREAEWLVMEWPDGEEKPTTFFLTTLPRRQSKKQLVRTIKERWRTERVYEELKGELGFDHFEGRSWPGWHHHVSVALCGYAFVVAERARAFPPSARGAGGHRGHGRAARPARGRFVRHRTATPSAAPGAHTAALPLLPSASADSRSQRTRGIKQDFLQ